MFRNWGPFKCYVTQMGEGMSDFQEKKRYKGVMFNVINVTRGWVGVQLPGKWRYVTLEWSLAHGDNHSGSLSSTSCIAARLFSTLRLEKSCPGRLVR